MNRFPIIRVIAKLIIPYILLFGLYVQFHGDFGPGGGFQAGVIIASAFILYGLVFGLPAVQLVAPPKVIEKLIAFGVLLYAGTGLATTLIGRPAGNYGLSSHDDHGHGHKSDHDHKSDHGHEAGHDHDHAADHVDHAADHADHAADHVDHAAEHLEPAADEVRRVAANFLDYEAFNHDYLHGFLPHGQHLGIFVIELGVGITVTAVMTMIFYCFAGRSPKGDDAPKPRKLQKSPSGGSGKKRRSAKGDV